MNKIDNIKIFIDIMDKMFNIDVNINNKDIRAIHYKNIIKACEIVAKNVEHTSMNFEDRLKHLITIQFAVLNVCEDDIKSLPIAESEKFIKTVHNSKLIFMDILNKIENNLCAKVNSIKNSNKFNDDFESKSKDELIELLRKYKNTK